MAPTRELWLSNLLMGAGEIADKECQEDRWLAPDAKAWECPDELINTLEHYVFEGFLEEYEPTFSTDQREAAFLFRDALNGFCEVTPRHLDPRQTLADPRWDFVRKRAAAFITAFSKADNSNS